MRVIIQGVGFDNLTMDEALDRAFMLCKSGGYCVTPNPEIVWICKKNPELKAAVNNANMVIADGIGIIYAAKILKKPLKERIMGIELSLRLMQKLAELSGSVFLLGAKPGVAELAAENLTKKYPGLVVCGTNDGYFTDSEPVIAKINAAKPDLLLVCLGAPKQEFWIQENKNKLPSCLMMAIGGSLDIFAGTVKRAPEKWINHNVEWLYRLLTQPRRIFRMLRLPLFLVSAIWQRIRGSEDY